jgi:hypothetical protein
MPSRFSTCFLQSTYGSAGNFELITENRNDRRRGFIHRWRNNDAGTSWIFSGHFFRTRHEIYNPSIIQDEAPGSGKLHAVAIGTIAGRTALLHFVRENAPTWGWNDPEELPNSSGRSYSGNPVFIQSSAHAGMSLDVFAPLAEGGIGHWYRGEGDWIFAGISQISLGRIDALALIESTLGRFEMLLRRGNRLDSISRGKLESDETWSLPQLVCSGATGIPGFIQSRYGTNGNFELVTANIEGGLTGNWCNNDDPMAPHWTSQFVLAPSFGNPGERPGDSDVVALIQSNYGTPGVGNLEVIARRGGTTDFFWRIDQHPWTWSGPYRIANDPPDVTTRLRGTGSLEERLAGCDDFQNEITWETPTGERRTYPSWSRGQKDRLNRLFQLLIENAPDLDLNLPDPAANMSLRVRDDGATCMFLTEAQAFDIYAAHVAHVLYLEAGNLVPWSILDLPSGELQELFSSDRYHARIIETTRIDDPSSYYPSHIRPNHDFQLPFRVQVSARPLGLCGDPRDGYRFVTGQASQSRMNRRGETEEDTLANLSRWFSQNVGHGGGPEDSNRDYYIHHTWLRDRLKAESRDWGYGHWTGIWSPSGCQSAANLLHDLARSVNIPLLNIMVFDGEHSSNLGLVFRWQRPGTRILHHTDDLYSAETLAPCFFIRDGRRGTEAEAARYFFETNWPLLADITAYGYTHSNSYEAAARPQIDCPTSGVSGGQWASPRHLLGYVFDKRFLLCSWRDFIKEHCDRILTEERILAHGYPLHRPAVDFLAQASRCDEIYSGCDSLRAIVVEWERLSGMDVWTDR